MNSDTKELIINSSIGLLVLIALFFAYFIFMQEGDNTVKQAFTRVKDVATGEAVVSGVQVANTITEIRELKNAVVSTTLLFESRAFTDLKDFSVPIPEEAVGRPNPFVPTAWKLRAITAEERARQANRAGSVSF